MQLCAIASIAGLLAGSVLAAPAPAPTTSGGGGGGNGASAQGANDGVGNVAPGSFSIIFGDGGSMGISSHVTRTTGDSRQQAYNLTCYDAQGSSLSDTWQTLDFSALLYTVDVHSGNACHVVVGLQWWYYDTWVNYANQHLNLRTDRRCSAFGEDGRGKRCVLPIKP